MSAKGGNGPLCNVHDALSVAGFREGETFELTSLVKGARGEASSPTACRFAATAEGREAAGRWLTERALIQQKARASGGAVEGGIHFCLNPIRPGRGRPSNDEVVEVRVLLIDVDPVDATPVCRSASAELAEEARQFIEDRIGVRPALIDSGRGRHLLLRHEPETVGDRARELRRTLLRALGARFDRVGARIDPVTFDAVRLGRMPGTVNLRTNDVARIMDPGDGRIASLVDLERLIGELSPPTVTIGTAPPTAATLRPFPAEALPPLLLDIVLAHARAVEAPLELAALPAMSILAAALGPRWKVAATRGFVRPPLNWFCVVAPSGSGKGPAARPLLAPVVAIDTRLYEEHKHESGQWEVRERARRGKKKAPADEWVNDPKPRRRRAFVTNATIEALLGALQDADGHGVLLHSDEVRTLLDGLDGYRARGGAQGRGEYLSLWDGAPTRLVRKVSENAECDRPFVAVLGGVQPSVLAKLELRDADGLAPRFLWAHVSCGERGLGEGVDPRVAALWALAVRLAAEHVVDEAQAFEPAGRDLLDRRHREWTRRAQELEDAGMGLRASFYGKAGDHSVRLAALLHGMDAIDLALREDANAPSAIRGRGVPVATVERTLLLVDYFLEHGIHTAGLVGRMPGAVEGGTASGDEGPFATALRAAVSPGSTVEDSPAGWSKRLAASGLELSPASLGRAFTRVAEGREGWASVSGLRVERGLRGQARSWKVTWDLEGGS